MSRPDLESWQQNDLVVVVGSGAAGLAAAISAAREDVPVLLVEKTQTLGGTVTQALIHTLGGLYDSSGSYINDGLAVELAERLSLEDEYTRPRNIGRTKVLNVSPDVYGRVIEAWIAEERRIKLLRSSEIHRIETGRDRIDLLEVSGHWGNEKFRPKAVIDATGSANVVRMIDQDLVVDEPGHASGGVIFCLHSVEPGALVFPNSVRIVQTIRQATEDGQLPSECAQAWLDAGVYDDEAYIKMSTPLPIDWQRTDQQTHILDRMGEIRSTLVSFLQEIPSFAKAEVAAIGGLGVREGGRVRGEYCLTELDVRAGKQFKDPACRCCWPIEYWDPENGVRLEYLPQGTYYEVPMRSLKVRGMANVWTAGKCLSADRLAQASARVAGTCWSMGEAVGRAAAYHS